MERVAPRRAIMGAGNALELPLIEVNVSLVAEKLIELLIVSLSVIVHPRQLASHHFRDAVK